MGGTVSGEHGVGVGKMEHVLEEHGEDHIDIQRSIKVSTHWLTIGSVVCRCFHYLRMLSAAYRCPHVGAPCCCCYCLPLLLLRRCLCLRITSSCPAGWRFLVAAMLLLPVWHIILLLRRMWLILSHAATLVLVRLCFLGEQSLLE